MYEKVDLRRAYMCESNVYLERDGKEELVASEVAYLTVENGKIILLDINSKRIELENVVIKYIDFLKHKVVLRAS